MISTYHITNQPDGEKTDAANGLEAISRVSKLHPLPSSDPGRSAKN